MLSIWVLDITSLDVDRLTNKLRCTVVERTIASKNMVCDGNIYTKCWWVLATFYSILYAECSAHYMQRRNKHSSSKFTTISSIWTKINRYFGLAGDISSFKRTFYSILDAERSARDFHLRNKPSGTKFATTYSILQKIDRYFGTFWDTSTLKRTFYSSLDAECSAHYMQCGNKPSGSQIWKHLTDFTEN